MVNIATLLTSALTAAGFPVVGVRIAGAAQSTWTVDPTGLTAQQAADANAFIQAFDADVAVLSAMEKDNEIAGLTALVAVVKATHELKTTGWTLAQFQARIKQIYRGL